MHSFLRFPSVTLLALVAACSSTEDVSNGGTTATLPTELGVACTTDTQCAGTAATPLCETQSKACVALPPGHEIGYRDGTASSVTLTAIYEAPKTAKLTDLAFNPAVEGEVWAVGYGDNTLYKGNGLDGEKATFKKILDPAAGHFMFKPPGIAFGAPGLIGTCGNNLNERGGGDGSAMYFMGPALFDIDPAVIGVRTSGGLGSHVDMLHNTPLCRGIAHEKKNIFWVFNGLDRSLDKYNFNAPHKPGGDDHSDGEIYRFAKGKVKGVEDGTPSHIFFDSEDNFLYVADTGNSRIVRLDTTKGTKGQGLERRNEDLKAEGVMNGTSVEEIVAPGTLEKPSGLEVKGGLIYVTDTSTSTIYVFDKTGKEMRKLKVDLPPESLAGMAFGPGGKLFFADKVASRIYRIDPL